MDLSRTGGMGVSGFFPGEEAPTAAGLEELHCQRRAGAGECSTGSTCSPSSSKASSDELSGASSVSAAMGAATPKGKHVEQALTSPGEHEECSSPGDDLPHRAEPQECSRGSAALVPLEGRASLTLLLSKPSALSCGRSAAQKLPRGWPDAAAAKSQPHAQPPSPASSGGRSGSSRGLRPSGAPGLPGRRPRSSGGGAAWPRRRSASLADMALLGRRPQQPGASGAPRRGVPGGGARGARTAPGTPLLSRATSSGDLSPIVESSWSPCDMTAGTQGFQAGRAPRRHEVQRRKAARPVLDQEGRPGWHDGVVTTGP